MNLNTTYNLNQFSLEIKQLGKELGFNQVGITDTNLTREASHLEVWLTSGFNGDMQYFTNTLIPTNTHKNFSRKKLELYVVA
ncbi:MAG: hypothetical protein LBL17_01000 [Coxiellaceae bacterium]|jgi:epoxyqueuosine reductase QueG|nr:hypothetical protein [Coxiellaceae bacterium]